MESILYTKSYELTLKLILIADSLEDKRKYFISNQLCRSATSISANISEANHSESKKDFVHKLKISSKEAQETEFWLSIIKDLKYEVIEEDVWDQLNHVQRMLSKSIATTINGMKK